MFGTRVFSLSLLFFLAFSTVETALASTGTPEVKFLLFGSMNCSACVRIKPRIDTFRENGWPITYIDADRDAELARRFQVQALPTFIMLFENREYDRIVGESDPDVMQQRIIELDKRCREFFRQNGPGLPQQPSSVNTTNNPALAASVRIRVNDPTGLSTGTGTIIDTRGGEALILTCAHIFRESRGEGPIEVDLFLENRVVNIQGECIDYDLEKDLAFVKFTVPPNTLIRAVPLAPRDMLHVGQNLISVGCDGGAGPTVRQHSILSLDTCKTPSTHRHPFYYIQVSGAPTLGRSGGGLFSADGYLVGVCNTGDPNSNDGHFVPLSVVRNQLDQRGISVVYQSPQLSSQSDQALVQPLVSSSEIALVSLSENPLSISGMAEVERNNPVGTHPFALLTPEERATVEEVRQRQAEGAEVILIVNPARKGTEKVQSEIIKLENVSEKFLDVLLERESVTAGSKNPHPTLTEQAAAMNRRLIAVPTGNVNRQQETGLRTQIITK